MDNLILKGAMLGLTISILIGPLLFAILQAGIEKGFLAGFSVAAGIWLSDVIFVTIIYHSLAAIENITAISGFKTWAGPVSYTHLDVYKRQSPGLSSKTIKFRQRNGYWEIKENGLETLPVIMEYCIP